RILFSGLGQARVLAVAPWRKNGTPLRSIADERDMQKRASCARAARRRGWPRLLAGLPLVLGATAFGLTGARGLQCSGGAMTTVSTSQLRVGPQGTSAENSSCWTGWVHQPCPRTLGDRI